MIDSLKQATLYDLLSYAAAILSIFFAIWSGRYYKKSKCIFKLKNLWTVIAIASESKVKVSELIVLISTQSLGVNVRGKSLQKQILFQADQINKNIINIEAEMPSEIFESSPINNIRSRSFYTKFLASMTAGETFTSENLNNVMSFFAEIVTFCKKNVEDNQNKLSS